MNLLADKNSNVEAVNLILTKSTQECFNFRLKYSTNQSAFRVTGVGITEVNWTSKHCKV